MSKDCKASKSYCRTNRNASHSTSPTAQHQTYVRRLVRSKVPNIFSRSDVGKKLSDEKLLAFRIHLMKELVQEIAETFEIPS